VKEVLAAQQLPDDAEERYVAMSPKEQERILAGLGLLLAQVADSIATGHNSWLSFGATKEKTSYTLSLYQFAGTLTLYDTDPLRLLSRASELL